MFCPACGASLAASDSTEDHVVEKIQEKPLPPSSEGVHQAVLQRSRPRRTKFFVIVSAGLVVLFLVGMLVLQIFLYIDRKNQEKLEQESTGSTYEEIIIPSDTDATSPKLPSAWRAVKSWEGTGNKTTEEFTITGSKWRMEYQFIGSNSSSTGEFVFQIYEKESGASERIAEMHIDRPTVNSYSVNNGGTFYVVITCPEGSWGIEIEEFR